MMGCLSVRKISSCLTAIHHCHGSEVDLAQPEFWLCLFMALTSNCIHRKQPLPCVCGKDSIITQLSQRHHRRDLMMDDSGSESSDLETFGTGHRTAAPQEIVQFGGQSSRTMPGCGSPLTSACFVRHLQAKMT